MFETEKILKKLLVSMDKSKDKKVKKILLENKDNIELFEKLIQETSYYHKCFLYLVDIDRTLSLLNPEIQKKFIKYGIHFIRGAGIEVRGDIDFIKELLNDDKYSYSDIEMICENLGPEVLNNKEFMLELAQRAPEAFARSIGNANYSDDELKTFFSQHPYLLNHLPHNLKTDLNYVSSCIFLMSPESANAAFRFFDYNYLMQEEIKTALIKKVGNKGYQKILAASASLDTDFLKQISPEDFKKMIITNPDVFIGISSDLFNFFHSNHNQRKNLSLINEITKISELKSSKINTPEKCSQILFNLSKSMTNELPYDFIYQNVVKHWDKISSALNTMIIEYEDLDGSKISYNQDDIFKRIYNILIAIENNNLDKFFQIFINYDLMGSDYVDNIKNVNITNDNIDFLKLICTTEIFTLDTNSMEVFNQLFKKISNLIKDPYLSVEILNQIVNDKKLYNLILQTDINILDQQLLYNLYNYVQSDVNEIVSINSIEDLRNITQTIKEHINNNDVFSNTLDGKKYLLLMEHFNLSLSSAKGFIHSYFTSDIDNSLYKTYPKIIYLKHLLEKVINAPDDKSLSSIASELKSANIEISFIEIQQIVNAIKQNYGSKINESLVSLNGTNGIYDFTDKEFNMLIHVIGAYGESPKGDIYDSWNTKEGTSKVSICTSFISDDNMGIAPTTEESVVLGFSNLPDDFLQIMSCNDLYSSGYKAQRSSRFLTPAELKNNTRHGHNELVISRRIGEYTESKLQPSYIICFDKINEKSKIAAQKFGVPIIFIDREKVAEKQHNEIINLMEQFKITLDPTLISKIICKQENNKAGYRLVRPDLIDKYFGQEFRQNNINQMFSAIENGLKNNNPNAVNAMNAFVKSIEEEADKFKITAETPHRRNTYDIDYDKFIVIFKENPNYNNNYEIPKEMSAEELYEKFIQCRDRLAESERAELQYINNNEIDMEQSISSKKVS